MPQDAETIALYNGGIAWPVYDQGTASWDALALGIQVESDKLATFSPDKAETLGVDRMSYIGGPTLAMLQSKLAEDVKTGYVPYAPTLGKYVPADEAIARYKNLSDWAAAHNGLLWVGTGPYYIDQVDTLASIVVTKRYADYVYPSDKWLIYSEPKLADISVSGPDTVGIGSQVTFNISLTYKGKVYPQDEVSSIKYLVIDADGNLAFSGEETMVTDGTAFVTLTPDQTAKLVEGSSRIEIIAVLTPVAKPSMGAFSFVTSQ